MENSKTYVIDFFADINRKTVDALLINVDKAVSENSSKIVIRLSSKGGLICSAFSAYLELRIKSNVLTIHNMGNVESSAMLLYLAAKTRTAMPGSTFLIHPLSWTYIPEKITLPALKKAIDDLNIDIDHYERIYKNRTEHADNPIDIRKYLENASFDRTSGLLNLDKDTYIIKTSEALAAGITTEEPADYIIPPGAIHTMITADDCVCTL